MRELLGNGRRRAGFYVLGVVALLVVVGVPLLVGTGLLSAMGEAPSKAAPAEGQEVSKETVDEAAAGLIRGSLFVCDDRALAVEMGAIGGAGLGPEHVHAELGEVISGARPADRPIKS